MTRKRKQEAIIAPCLFTNHPLRKRRKFDGVDATGLRGIEHGTLQLFYSNIFTLRQYMLSRLPVSAKKRRHRLAFLGSQPIEQESSQSSILGARVFKDAASSLSRERALSNVASVLDSTYVCPKRDVIQHSQDDFEKDFISFSQSTSKEADRSRLGSSMSISDIVDYVIWLLFNRVHRNNARPPHLLCHGFQRAQPLRREEEKRLGASSVFGLSMRFLNRNVSVLKSATWDAILVLLGQGGDKIMLDLLLGCDVFVTLSSGSGNVSQLSGMSDPEVKEILLEG